MISVGSYNAVTRYCIAYKDAGYNTVFRFNLYIKDYFPHAKEIV